MKGRRRSYINNEFHGESYSPFLLFFFGYERRELVGLIDDIDDVM